MEQGRLFFFVYLVLAQFLAGNQGKFERTNSSKSGAKKIHFFG